ncbi:cation transporter [Kineobactrum sediminis]|uniref:Cation transporter n=1 Tax=Kineobactrum sediminis TaxID=1905677 RepID=A0A2N5Y179_9GAMM|nr:cation diffusion facilitator family transporter [Kineobactrum sediminis]PLW82146.1 cation transporter [Kineobactrum sediminis]
MNAQHQHAPASYGKAFTIGITLNFGFVIIEAIYGWRTGSLALLADAAHNLSDVGALLLAWAAFAAGRLPATRRRTYGWGRASILASLVNATVLLVGMVYLAWVSIQRLQTSVTVDAGTVMIVAGIGVVINAATAWLFLAGSKHDLNIRGAFLHMAADTLVSVGVVIAGGLYLWRGWTWIDPAVGLLIAMMIIIATWSLFRQSLHLLFDGVPYGLEFDAVRSALLELPGVIDVHDLHVWAMSTEDNALTAHLVVESYPANDELLEQAVAMLKARFGIQHAALQQESTEFAARCQNSGLAL